MIALRERVQELFPDAEDPVRNIKMSSGSDRVRIGGTGVTLVTNYFKVVKGISDLKTLFEYNLSFKPELNSGGKRRRILWVLLEQNLQDLQTQHGLCRQLISG
jgi:hypothetical protein